MRKSNTTTVTKSDNPRYRWMVRYPDAGKRRRQYFKLKTEAIEWGEKKQAEINAQGMKHESFTDEERSAVIAFRDAISKLPIHAQTTTLSQVVQVALESITARNKSITCHAVADSLRDELELAGRSDRHIADTRQRLGRFNAIYGDRMACDITTEIVKDFLTHESPPKSRNHYRRAIGQMFNHAIKLKASPSNPVSETIKVKTQPSETGILKPLELNKLILCANDDTLPALVISFFAGVRRAEIERMDWSEIDLDEGFIEVTAKNAKTAQRRLIEISPNLKAWLLPHARPSGKLIRSKQIYRKGLEKARRLSGLTEWPHNAGRHSYASYHLAKNEDAGKLAMSLGHPDPRLLYRHYRQLVTKKAANTYWSITPEVLNNVKNMKTA